MKYKFSRETKKSVFLILVPSGINSLANTAQSLLHRAHLHVSRVALSMSKKQKAFEQEPVSLHSWWRNMTKKAFNIRHLENSEC